MTQINSYNFNINSRYNYDLESGSNKKREIKLNTYLKEYQKTYSFPIFCEYCNDINKEEKIYSKNLIKNNLEMLGKEGFSNSDFNCSSTLEIIEYPLSEIPKNIDNKNNIIGSNKHNYDNNLRYYKNPVDIKGDDDDLFLNEEDFEKNNQKGKKNKLSSQNINSQNWSKSSSVVSDLFFDYNNHKKIIVILNNTKKYHQELKNKINNYKKLIYPIKDNKSENIHAYSNKKINKDNNMKYNTDIKNNKNEKEIYLNYSNKKNIYLKSYKKECLQINKKINYDNYTGKDTSTSDIKGNERFYNITNFSNNSTIKTKDNMNNLFPEKSFKSRINKKFKNNLKKEINDTEQISSKKFNINFSSITKTDQKENIKNELKGNKLNNIKNGNSLIPKGNLSTSSDKSKYIWFNKNHEFVKHQPNININKNNYKKKNIKKYEKNSTSKFENILSNKKNTLDLNHIFPYSNQRINKKNEKNKVDITYINNKVEVDNPFKEDHNKKKKIYSLKEIYFTKNNRGKNIKNKIITHSPTTKYMYFSS